MSWESDLLRAPSGPWVPCAPCPRFRWRLWGDPFFHFGRRAPASFKMFQLIWVLRDALGYPLVNSHNYGKIHHFQWEHPLFQWIHQDDAELQHWQLLSSLEEIDESASALEQLEQLGAKL